MMLTIPGQILVVDDKREEVEDLIQTFMRAGQGVIYIRGVQDITPERLTGVRLVVLDLDLNETGQVEEEDYELAALVLRRLALNGHGFYLIAVWSQHVGEPSILERLQGAYREQTGHLIPGLFLEPFDKNHIDQEEVAGKIAEWIERQPSAGLVFEWERLLNRARDYATSDILDLEGGSLASLVKVLRKEIGEGANRELVQLFNKVLLRYMTTGDLVEIRELMDRLGKDGGVDLNWYVKFHQFQAYYSLDDTESIWTGDIWSTSEEDQEKQFAILITPACDLAQSKARYLKVAYAVLLEPWSTAKNKFRMGKGKAVAALTHTNPEPETGEEGPIIPDLPQNIYPLPFFPTNDTFSWLLVDLSQVEAVRSDHFTARGWKRICRLDSPYIEDLMHRYAALSERVGMPTIPEEIREAEARRLRGA